MEWLSLALAVALLATVGVTGLIPEADLDHNLDHNSAYLMPLPAALHLCIF